MNLIVSLINSFFPEPHASLFNGILLGRDLFVTQAFYQHLKDVGLIHIVVLSGMNITLLSAIIINTLVKFISRFWTIIITIVIILFFVLFVGAEPPIIRAAIMGILSLIAILYGRQTMAIYTLFLSGVIMLLWHNEWLLSISFQLSFAATLGIILFGRIEHNKIQNSKLKVQSGKSPLTACLAGSLRIEAGGRAHYYLLATYLKEELRISLAAQVFTLPIIFWYFRTISLVSPLANVLVAWLIAPIMILGMIIMGCGFVSWKLGFLVSWLVYPLLSFIVLVVETLAKIPYASVKL